MKNFKIFTDGGSRGNPGPAAIGIYILSDDNKCLLKFGKQIGVATNNIAEYSAVLFAFDWLKERFDNESINYEFYSDSTLVVNQLNGVYKIKNLEIKKLIMKIKELEKNFLGKINYNYIPREKNTIADSLVNSSF